MTRRLSYRPDCSTAAASLAVVVIWAVASGRVGAADDTSAVTVQNSAALRSFLTRPEPVARRYRAFRRLEAINEKFGKAAWLEAWTELDPVRGFRYEIVAAGGSPYIRRRVLEAALVGEARAHATGQAAQASLTLDNYEFQPAGSDADGLLKLLVKPRRKDYLLFEGAIFLTPGRADLVRLEGRLSKNPSFWTKRVDIVRQYGRVAGFRVPLSLESRAQIKMAGIASFVMSYEYQMIEGREVGRVARRTPATEAPRHREN